MSPDRLADELTLLRQAYGEVKTAAGGPGQVLVGIAAASLPSGAAPLSTQVLLVVTDGQRPQLYVKGGIRLPNGVVPRNYNPAQVMGEEWWSFSYNFAWNETDHTLVQFVAASLQRFAKLE